MSLRDRFLTPTTAQAILSWRILIGVGVAAAMAATGLPLGAAVAVGAGLYGALVATAMPRGPRRPAIDAFALSEPWRQFVQGALRAAGKLRETIDATADGPLRERVAAVAAKLEHGLDETWRIARRGDEIDAAIRRLDPTALRSRLATLHELAASSERDAAITSVENQLASVDRMRQQSERTASTLRLSQTRYDELVSRAAEIAIGAGDTAAYEHDVEDLVIELEALRQAVEETRTA